MRSIPPAPLLLGLAGLIPFMWGALTLLSEPLAIWGVTTVGARFVGPFIQLFYGAIILSFMSGVLWGFATKAEGRLASVCYGLSTLPALWAFFMTGYGPTSAALSLISGFSALLLLDYAFFRWGLTPAWWMRLRFLLTAVVVGCLSIGLF